MAIQPGERGALRARFRDSGSVSAAEAIRLEFIREGREMSRIHTEQRLDQDIAVQHFIGMADVEIGRRGLYGAAVAREIEMANEARQKSESDDIVFLAMLHSMAEIEARIDFHEDRLRARYGGDFIRGAAEDILGPDKAQRLPGETDADYAARMKSALQDEIFDSDGNLKPEYRHLDIAQWLLWQRQKQIREMTEAFLKDGEITPDEQAELDRVFRTGSANEVHQARRAILASGMKADAEALANAGEAVKRKADIEETTGGTPLRRPSGPFNLSAATVDDGVPVPAAAQGADTPDERTEPATPVQTVGLPAGFNLGG